MAALMAGFGQAEGLFLSLRNSRAAPGDAVRVGDGPEDHDEEEDDDRDLCLETDAEILKNVTEDKMAAYE